MAHEPHGAADLLTTAQAAKRLGVHVATIRRWATEGHLPVAFRTPGGRRRYSAHDVEALRKSA